MLVESGARELGPYNIRVNGIAPGLTKTDLIAGTESIPGYLERVAKRTPLGRIERWLISYLAYFTFCLIVGSQIARF